MACTSFIQYNSKEQESLIYPRQSTHHLNTICTDEKNKSMILNKGLTDFVVLKHYLEYV